MIDWSPAVQAMGGIAGATTVALAFAKHMPAPKCGSILYRWLFDSVQDLAKNHERIGEVRKPCSAPDETEQQ